LRGIYAEMRQQGMTGLEIAARLGQSPTNTYRDLKALGFGQGCRGCPPGEKGRERIMAAKIVMYARQRDRHEEIAARTEKTCPRCPWRGPQPLSAFYRNRGTVDGRGGFCRRCYKAWRVARDSLLAAELEARERAEREALEREQAEFATAVEAIRAQVAEAKRLGVPLHRLAAARAAASTPQPERDCCWGNGNGQHDGSCLFASRAS
jgi:hypothetical protein